MQRPVSLLTEQRSLRGWPAEGGRVRGLVRSLLVEAEAFAMNFEETLGGFPVLAFAAHAFTKDARIEFAIASFANSVHHSIGLRRQFLAQTFLKIRRDIAW